MNRPSRLTHSLAVIALLLAAGTGISACSSSGSPAGATSASISTGSHLDPSAFEAAMTEPNTAIVDVRTPSEFAAGHIAGAINIDIEGADFTSAISSLDQSKTYALYCHSGRRSGLAIAAMQQAGFTSVYDLNGGIQNWQAAGKTLVTG